MIIRPCIKRTQIKIIPNSVIESWESILFRHCDLNYLRRPNFSIKAL